MMFCVTRNPYYFAQALFCYFASLVLTIRKIYPYSFGETMHLDKYDYGKHQTTNV